MQRSVLLSLAVSAVFTAALVWLGVAHIQQGRQLARMQEDLTRIQAELGHRDQAIANDALRKFDELDEHAPGGLIPQVDELVAVLSQPHSGKAERALLDKAYVKIGEAVSEQEYPQHNFMPALDMVRLYNNVGTPEPPPVKLLVAGLVWLALFGLTVPLLLSRKQ